MGASPIAVLGKDAHVLRWMQEFQQKWYGQAPTIREIMAGVPELTSTSTTQSALKRLERAGKVAQISVGPRRRYAAIGHGWPCPTCGCPGTGSHL